MNWAYSDKREVTANYISYTVRNVNTQYMKSDVTKSSSDSVYYLISEIYYTWSNSQKKN